MTTGMDLKVERIRERVTVSGLAKQMGVSRQTVHAIEGRAVVKTEQERKYRDALTEVAEGMRT